MASQDNKTTYGGAYSTKYQLLGQDMLRKMIDEHQNSVNAIRERTRVLSKQTIKRQKGLEEKKQAMAKAEGERRRKALEERRKQQQEATNRFRSAIYNNQTRFRTRNRPADVAPLEINLREHHTSSPLIEQPSRKDRVTVTREFFREQISSNKEKSLPSESKTVLSGQHLEESKLCKNRGASDLPPTVPRDTCLEQVPSIASTDTIQSSLECITLSPTATEGRVFEPVNNTFTVSDDESLTSLHDSLESSPSPPLTPLQSPIRQTQSSQIAKQEVIDSSSNKQTTEQSKPKIVGILKKSSLIQAASDISVTSIANTDSFTSKHGKKVRFKDNTEASSEDSSRRHRSAVTPHIKISLTHPSRHQNGVIPHIISMPNDKLPLDMTPTDEDIDALWTEIKGYFPHKQKSLISLPPSSYTTSHQHHIINHTTRATRRPSNTRMPRRQTVNPSTVTDGTLTRTTHKAPMSEEEHRLMESLELLNDRLRGRVQDVPHQHQPPPITRSGTKRPVQHKHHWK